jgi:hypothetical protein
MVWAMDAVKGWSMDVQCLSSMWFKRIKGKSHKDRLEAFYSPQAHACELHPMTVVFLAKSILNPHSIN